MSNIFWLPIRVLVTCLLESLVMFTKLTNRLMLAGIAPLVLKWFSLECYLLLNSLTNSALGYKLWSLGLIIGPMFHNSLYGKMLRAASWQKEH